MALSDTDRAAIRELVNSAPPLTDEQRATLAIMLKPPIPKQRKGSERRRAA
jgi:hypothetical protein